MKKGIVIAFPGIRYTCRQQLMQDCLAFYTARGYETLCLDFAGVPFDGTADMGRAAELALPSILGRLSGVRFADYTDVAFLAKSLGTLCAVRTAKALGLRPRFFLLTPLEETLQVANALFCRKIRVLVWVHLFSPFMLQRAIFAHL